ncbi:hypothetical protein [Psychrobacter sp. FDAARGOS_221]|uniref:hypothetical protein n=1 Tax=Psychrobacter sp. FDAARGOS_221 TaxID=1975705 RepID=UPI000BB56049|nr:hypothetical protein [Psychrobacter sp. FDAARGOS_221]PNK60276.1 hypothetical protein A6J60_004925 [Psychrobacter sp. FDAARGOS_221]
MSYPLLLLIISLIVIVPTVFVVKGKSKQKLLANKNKGQAYLAHSSPAAKGVQPTAEQLQIVNKIEHYRSHPGLPISFRQLLTNIHSQYLTLTGVQLAPDQRFTVDKLAGTRLAEIIESYLSLDKEYAEQSIIDPENDITSQDAVYGQLTSMLEFMQQVQHDGQAQAASNILANRNYLQAVYGEYQPDGSSQDSAKGIKAPVLDASDIEEPATAEQLKEQGLQYLIDCDDASNQALKLADYDKVFGDQILTQLGQLSSTVQQTVIYSQALLTQQQPLPAFQQILSQALPRLLRQSLTAHLQQLKAASDDSYTEVNDSVNKATDKTVTINSTAETGMNDALILQKISRVQQLVDDCLNRLQKLAQQQYETGGSSEQDLQSLQNTLKSKHSQAQYLLDNGFFS